MRPEQPGGGKAAEAAADDDHPVPAGPSGLMAAHVGWRTPLLSEQSYRYSPGLECMMPPSANTVVAVR